ncbi:MAG TPA: hypothetical protein VFP44_04065 [Usitatibacter sp.]|nr:hypothetical protein [Usitatibacter sp.]
MDNFHAAHDASLRRHLHALKALRGDRRASPARLNELKRWQSARLAATYADLSQQPRYHTATRFFLHDLYGPKDFSHRDEAMMRILPAMSRLLPKSAVETAALAIELEALSEELDHRVAAALPAGPITEASYAEANRRAVDRRERERQIDLTEAVGHRLDALVRKPLVVRTLQLMRGPARAAGLSDLQDFLERGFSSFRAMHGAGEFLATLRRREMTIIDEIYQDPVQARTA